MACGKIVYSGAEKGLPSRAERRRQEKHKIALKCSRPELHDGDCMPLGEIYRRLSLGEKIHGWRWLTGRTK